MLVKRGFNLAHPVILTIGESRKGLRVSDPTEDNFQYKNYVPNLYQGISYVMSVVLL